MEAQHEHAIQRLVEIVRDDPRFLALIISGSIAHGNARPSSDVDVLLVASDEEYARRVREQDFAYFNMEVCDYPGGYIDGKVIDLHFLHDAADHGSEPTRYALVGAFPAYTRIPELSQFLARITTYPEHERQQKMDAFYSQVLVSGNYFIGEAVKHNNAYLLMHTAADLVLFGSRLLLAYNRAFFPCHKSLQEAVQRIEQKPANFLPLAEALLREPGTETAKAFCTCITDFRDWGIDYIKALNRFLQDSEWNWREGRPPLEDW